MLRSIEGSEVFVEIFLLDFALRIRSDPKAHRILLDLELLPSDVQQTDGSKDECEGEVGFLGSEETKAEEGSAQEVVQLIIPGLDCVDRIQQTNATAEMTRFRLRPEGVAVNVLL